MRISLLLAPWLWKEEKRAHGRRPSKRFLRGGALAVQGGESTVGPVNAISPMFKHVILTQDWHPRGHVSFASSWPGRALYDSVEAEGIPQVLWPDHCVQGSRGADFHPDLDTEAASLILRKGMGARLDSYSAFFENDRTTPTGLDGWLRAVDASELLHRRPCHRFLRPLHRPRRPPPRLQGQRRRGRCQRRGHTAGWGRPRLQCDATRGSVLRRMSRLLADAALLADSGPCRER